MVLAEHTEASKAHQDLVLAEVAARLEAEHGAGRCRSRGQTRARAAAAGDHQGHVRVRREHEGQAVDRRPPGGAYGRLRATRPG